VKRTIFIVFLFLLFILMSVRSYNPAYSNLPSVLKSIIQLKHAPAIKLPDIKVSPTEDVPVQIREESVAEPDETKTQSD
jgi:hypothetical protein